MSDATSPTDRKSLMSEEFSTTLNLCKMSLRMQGADTKLISLHNIVRDKNLYEHQKKQPLAILKHAIVPYIKASSSILSSLSDLLALITDTNYVNSVYEHKINQK